MTRHEQNIGLSNEDVKKSNRIWLAILGIFLLGFATIIVQELIHVFSHAKIAATKAKVITNLREDAVATLVYATDHDNYLPPDMFRENLQIILSPYHKNPTEILQPLPGEFAETNQALAGIFVSTIEEAANVELYTFSSENLKWDNYVADLDTRIRSIPK